MEKKMKFLICLQDCDTRIGEVQSKKKEGPLKINRLREELDQSKTELEAEINRFESYKKERRAAEQEIQELERKTEKSTIKLNNIKSNKEYKAALKELADLEKEKALIEDNLLEIMEQIEIHNEKCVSSKAKWEEMEKNLQKENNDILRELKTLDKALKDLENERAHICEAIDEGLLAKYNTLRQNKEGLAISPVINGVCQTCHMGIPPQKFNELIRGDRLMSCPNCVRIIYWGEDERYKDVVEKG